MTWLIRMLNKFRANIGIVSLDAPTSEEEDILDAIAHQVASPMELENGIYVWDFANGMQKCISVAGSGIAFEEAEAFKECEDPIPALNAIDKYQHSGLFILRDIHPFLTGDRASLEVIRFIKNLSRNLPNAGREVERDGETIWLPLTKRIVILGQDMSFPRDYFNVVHHLFYSPPELRELEETTSLMFEEFRRKHLETHGTELLVNLTPAERQRLNRAAQGLTRNEYQTSLQEAVITFGAIDARTVEFVTNWKIEKLLVYDVEFSNPPNVAVGGFDLLNEWIDERVDLFNDQLESQGTGLDLPPPKGVVLVGPPGTGKSLTAKTIGYRLGLPTLRVDIGGMFTSLVGETGARIRRMLRTAEAIAPCVLWLDEIDKAFAAANGPVTDGGTAKDAFNAVLTFLSEKTSAVFVVATANRVDGLPPELLRAGRFDEVFKLDLPNSNERRQILGIHLNKRKVNLGETQIAELVKATKDWTGAELDTLVYNALVSGRSRCRKAGLPLSIEKQDFNKVLESMVAQAVQNPEGIQQMRDLLKNVRPASTPEVELEKTAVSRKTTRNMRL